MLWKLIWYCELDLQLINIDNFSNIFLGLLKVHLLTKFFDLTTTLHFCNISRCVLTTERCFCCHSFRLISLNESVLNQKDEILKLQAALSQKELELQQSQAQLTGPRTELESCRLERDELRQKLEEAERRQVFNNLSGVSGTAYEYSCCL